MMERVLNTSEGPSWGTSALGLVNWEREHFINMAFFASLKYIYSLLIMTRKSLQLFELSDDKSFRGLILQVIL